MHSLPPVLAGAVARFARGSHRAVLRSASFRLPSAGQQQLDMHLEASLSTFGSRLYICPVDEQQQAQHLQKTRALQAALAGAPAAASAGAEGVPQALQDPLHEFGHCQLLLGPKVRGLIILSLPFSSLGPFSRPPLLLWLALFCPLMSPTVCLSVFLTPLMVSFTVSYRTQSLIMHSMAISAVSLQQVHSLAIQMLPFFCHSLHFVQSFILSFLSTVHNHRFLSLSAIIFVCSILSSSPFVFLLLYSHNFLYLFRIIYRMPFCFSATYTNCSLV